MLNRLLRSSRIKALANMQSPMSSEKERIRGKIEIVTPTAKNFNNTSFNMPNTATNRTRRLEKSFMEPRDLMTLAEENIRHAKKKELLSFPIFSLPLRIELPYIFNTPRRNKMPVSIVQASLAYKTDLPTIKNLCGEVVSTEERRKYQKRIRDYLLLAGACRRANKLRDEGRAYYSIGVLCDNILNFSQALTYYYKFLEICKAVKDTYGKSYYQVKH